MTDLPALVATDLDGTFLSPDGTVSALNARAVAAARDAGIQVVFATGRPPTWMGPITDLGMTPTPVIACNGALRYDASSGEILDCRDLPADVVETIAAGIAPIVPHATIGIQWPDAFGAQPGYFTDPPGGGYLVDTVPALLGRAGPILKVLVQTYGTGLDDLVTTLHSIAGDAVSLTWSTPGSAPGERVLIEVGAAGVDKAAMLARHCAELGITADGVAAFGDMPNDHGMLAWAGRPYVMTPCHPLLHDLGARQAGSNAEDAVGRTILSWLQAPRP